VRFSLEFDVANDGADLEGTSGVVAWEIGEKKLHLIVMWSVPYNLAFYDAHFGFGVVPLR